MTNCKDCKETRKKQKFENDLAMAVAEKANKRLFIVVVILLVALFVTNGLWIYRETQFEDVRVTQEVEQDAENGENHFVGGDSYGKATNQDNN